MPCANGKNQNTDNKTNYGERFADSIQLLLERCVCVVLSVQHSGNVSYFCVHTGGDHNARCASIGYNRGGIGHVAAVAERAVLRQNVLRFLFGRDRLTGQRGLLYL